ncbi:MAG: class I SAM-dependent methyltransferase [Planctomycetota bacterium]|nr:class I SAM-dependent methyltransferase [Planctomycetota bacterium]
MKAKTEGHVGHETLHRLSGMDRTNRWMFDVLAPHLGAKVIEAGSGSGNLTRYLLDREKLLCLDIDPDHVRSLESRYADLKNVTAKRCELSDSHVAEITGTGWDTVVCINVLEHIRNDRRALRNFHEVLRPGGRLVLLVPAIPLLFSTLDEALDHHRRYTRSRLVYKMESAGFRLIESRYLNFFGIAGWFLSGKILRRRILPSTLLGLFNAMVPAFRAFERLTGPPIGLSVIAIGEKPKMTP